ncbi:VanZ family protein [Lacimicrobium sp. SS2-24]|uniref:VanZ family protein n=1 Tax=Lacimicrobium sp. SS2-24 TaxID=2005569 RepID=UPI000B4B4FDA|nr:VanZ family protein [Lacimicrobium sp. SS2-24]
MRFNTLIKRPWLFYTTLTTLLIFCVMLWIPPAYVFLDMSLDKYYHVIFFASVTLLGKLSLNLNLAWLLCLVMLFAMLTELSQHWIPYRHSSWEDLQANLIGIGIGVMLTLIPRLRRLWRTKA